MARARIDDLALACMISARRPLVLLLGVVIVLALVSPAGGHEDDPQLLDHWRVHVHLLFQWAHLVAFGLWLGVVLAAPRVPRLGLEPLLFWSWGLFLVSLGTGSYNMAFSAATPESPDVLSLAALRGRWPFADAYVILVGAKQALLILAVLWTALVTTRHLRWPPGRDRARLRAAFVAGSAGLGLTLAAATAMALLLHEAIDLAPTPLHSLGGVLGPRGPGEGDRAAEARRAAPVPYGTDLRSANAGFRLFAVPQAAMDAAARFGHLVGFALWLGGTAAALCVPAVDVRRLLPLLWLGLAVQVVTGAYQMGSWTPFAVIPYPWRLALMVEFRFGYTYTLLLTVKLGLAALAVLGTTGVSLATRPAGDRHGWSRPLTWMNLVVGLLLASVAVALLFVHEGVDHAI